ncbi:MAG: VWA domain-containing protein, partial [Acidobacteria bacterium]|nr:VWA domain-containing protein [Acidobacteriota bacterium]
MKFITYKKFQPGDLDSLDMQELVNRLADFFLQSGFSPAYDYLNEMDAEQTLEQLRQAILDAIQNGELFSDEEWQQLMEQLQNLSAEQQQEVAGKLMERLEEEGYISISGPPQPSQPQPRPGAGSLGREGQVRFELTDKSLDFLGFKTLKDLLASLGRSSFGRHDTRDLATGIESGGASRRYEFGDTINLDVAGTLSHAIQREGSHLPLNIEYEDLMVHQTEYQSSCATVLMLDCSHSMILYGEDRFTPAKRVALALSHLIRTQYPGDSLHLILFHDSAEEMPLSQLARVQVGPYYTNTREGLRLAQRVLNRQHKDMRQIIMITDGKPS